MLSFSAPAWLTGLVVIPLIWWLHRLGDPDASAPVSAAFLFSAPADEAPTRRTRPRAHPLWIFRAAIFGLMVLALAGSFRPSPEHRVTAWFDDSLSMHAHEEDESRTGIAARMLGAALDETDPSQVRIHSLSDHRRSFDPAGLAGERRAAAIDEWVNANDPGSPRIPLVLPHATEHWLLTDGADSRVNAWQGDAAFSRVIAVGSATENTAVTALMARRSLRRDALHRGSVRVTNLGKVSSVRTLTVFADGQVIASESIEIAPGAVSYRNFQIPVEAATVTARLNSGDALARDDILEIGLAELRPVAVALDDHCGPRLRAALGAHPGLESQAGADREPGLTVRCGHAPEPSDAPSIQVRAGNDYQPVTGPLRWHRPVPGLPNLCLDPAWLRLDSESARPPSDRTILSAPDPGISLIEGQAGSIDVFLDLEHAPLAGRPEYPLLVNALAEFALARPVLDPVVRAARQPAESLIARQAAPEAGTAPGRLLQDGTDLAPYLLMLGVLLVVLDILFALPAGPFRWRASRGFR